jgi:hypothetical protein
MMRGDQEQADPTGNLEEDDREHQRGARRRRRVHETTTIEFPVRGKGTGSGAATGCEVSFLQVAPVAHVNCASAPFYAAFI